MNIEELENFINTEEGAAWLEEKKAPLNKKKDELLSEVKTLRADMTELQNSASGANSALQQEREALKELVINRQLDNAMEDLRIHPKLKNAFRSELEEAYSFEVQADGNDRRAVARDKDGNETDLSEVLNTWGRDENGNPTEDLKAYQAQPVNKGAGAHGVRPEDETSSNPEAGFRKALGLDSN